MFTFKGQIWQLVIWIIRKTLYFLRKKEAEDKDFIQKNADKKICLNDMTS